MTDLEPTGDKVYDPDLGGERDAFPGEVVNPEEEKTMQRLMRLREEEFRKQYDRVASSGQMSEDELNALLKAGKIDAELARKEYLEAIRSNPATIIKNVLESGNPVSGSLQAILSANLDSRIRGLGDQIRDAKTADEVAGRPIQDLAAYVDKAITLNSIISSVSEPEGRSLDINQVEQILAGLAAFPNPEVTTISQLIRIIRQSGNIPGQSKPYFRIPQSGRTLIADLPANLPGLQGVKISLSYDGNEFVPLLREFNINGDVGAWTRIIQGNQVVNSGK